MKKIDYLYLALPVLFFISCSDELSYQSDLETNDCIEADSQLTAQQRSEIAKSQLQNDDFTRWHVPWWDMSDEAMADSIRAVDGEVIISFKEPDELAGVDLKGKVLVSDHTKECGIKKIISLGAEVISKNKLHPSVLAEIPDDTELISTIRNHPFVDIFEPNVRGSFGL